MTPLAQFKASFASLSLTLKKMFSPSGGNSPCRATLSGGGFIIEFDIPVHLRYSDISTTLNIYAHVLPEMHQEAMEKMDTFLRGEK